MAHIILKAIDADTTQVTYELDRRCLVCLCHAMMITKAQQQTIDAALKEFG